MNEPRRGPRPVDVAAVIEGAHLGDLKWVFSEDRPVYDLTGAIERLFTLLEERRVDFVLVGGLALLHYVEGRNTRDIELVMAASDLERLPELGASPRDGGFAEGSFEGVKVDVLLTSNRVFAAFRERFVTTGEFAGRQVQCATPEGLVLLNLFALPSLYRQGQNARAAIYETDILLLLQQYEVDTDTLLAVLSEDMLATDIEVFAASWRPIARSSQSHRSTGLHGRPERSGCFAHSFASA